MQEYINKVICGDCLEFMKGLPDNCIDSIVTDPPAGISFMGKDWDSNKGGRDEWIKWMQSVMSECLRVLKSGGHAFVWAIPRTSHWTATAIENAGFEIRDIVTHHFGSGFPKSLNISKAIDKKFGADREVVGYNSNVYPDSDNWGKESKLGNGFHKEYVCGKPKENKHGQTPIEKPATPQAKQYEGFGTALKPASEHWILARKSLAEKTIADNVLKYSTGGINIDACRIGTYGARNNGNSKGTVGSNSIGVYGKAIKKDYNKGRFPSNVILSHHPECKEIGVKEVKGISGGNSRAIQKNCYNDYGKNYENKPDKKKCGFADKNGKETVPYYECHPDCPVKMLDKQSGNIQSSYRPVSGIRGQVIKGVATKFNEGLVRSEHYGFNDTGTASRFFYCAKASRTERNKGCDNLEEKNNMRVNAPRNCENDKTSNKMHNTHPCVKPKKLMQYLIKMITPPNGIVLDIFSGSGSTLVACKSLGFDFIGIEREKEYVAIANERIKAEQAQLKLPL